MLSKDTFYSQFLYEFVVISVIEKIVTIVFEETGKAIIPLTINHLKASFCVDVHICVV